MKITFYGQSCLGIKIGDINVLVDPFITGNDLAKDKINIKDFGTFYLCHSNSIWRWADLVVNNMEQAQEELLLESII